MASQQAQGPDPLRSRSAFIGGLTKLYNEIDHMIKGTASLAEAQSAQKALTFRYSKYIESHDLALAASTGPHDPICLSHNTESKRYSDYSEVILAYIQSLEETPSQSELPPPSESSSPSHSQSSKTSHATVVAQSQPAASHKSQSVRSTRSHTTRRSSQVSKSSSARLSEVRVQAEPRQEADGKNEGYSGIGEAER